MRLTLGGTVYTSPVMRLYDVSLGEAREIKKMTGLTIQDWRLGLLTFNRLDPDVLLGLVWLLRTRAGETPHLDELNMIPVAELTTAFDWSEDLETMGEHLRATLHQPPDEPAGPQAAPAEAP